MKSFSFCVCEIIQIINKTPTYRIQVYLELKTHRNTISSQQAILHQVVKSYDRTVLCLFYLTLVTDEVLQIIDITCQVDHLILKINLLQVFTFSYRYA